MTRDSVLSCLGRMSVGPLFEGSRLTGLGCGNLRGGLKSRLGTGMPNARRVHGQARRPLSRIRNGSIFSLVNEPFRASWRQRCLRQIYSGVLSDQVEGKRFAKRWHSVRGLSRPRTTLALQLALRRACSILGAVGGVFTG
jgi:hypothetical protein